MLEPVGIPDRDGDLPHSHASRIAEPRPRQRGIDTQDGEVGARILADEIRAKRATVGEHHLQPRRTVDDVVICQDETVRCKDDAGAGALVAAVDIDDGGTDGLDGSNHRV